MKKLFLLTVVILSLKTFAQTLTPTYCVNCDIIGWTYKITNEIADTCNWNILYKPDTCTLTDYNCRMIDTCASDTSVCFHASGGITAMGTTSTYNYIHRTGVFRIEIEMRFSWYSGTMVLLSNTVNTLNGFYLYTTNGTTLNLYMRSNNAVVLNTTWTNALLNYTSGFQGVYADTKNKLILIGDGTGVTLYSEQGDYGSVSLGKKNYTGAIVNTGNAAFALSIGRTNATAYTHVESYIRNIKFYTSQNQSALYSSIPMKVYLTRAKDIVLNNTGVITGEYMINVGRCNRYRPCLSQGWKYAVYNMVEDTIRVSLGGVNKPAYMYVEFKPTPFGMDWFGTNGRYYMVLPKTIPLRLQNKLVISGNKIVTTSIHNVFSVGYDYNDLP